LRVLEKSLVNGREKRREGLTTTGLYQFFLSDVPNSIEIPVTEAKEIFL
jgi:hypothetical protein